MCVDIQLVHLEIISSDVVTVPYDPDVIINALQDIIYHTLLVDDAGSCLEKRCSSTSFNRLGEVYHLNFTNSKPACFDVSIWNTMQPSYITPSSTLAGAAVFAGEEEKDAHQSPGGCFYRLIVETFGFGHLLV